MELQTDAGTLYYDVVGSGPALLIPGYASTPKFHEFAAYFTDRYTVLGLDLPHNSGKTTMAADHYSFDDVADDCLAVVRAAGFERTHYLGLSHTGVLGMAFALRHPEHVDRLALTMTTPGSPQGPAQTGDAISERQLTTTGPLADLLVRAQGGDEGAIREIAALAFSPEAAAHRPELVDREVQDSLGPTLTTPPEVQRLHWAGMAEFSARGRLGKISAPTLVMTGAGDRMVPLDDSWTMWREIPNATLVGLRQVGHNWYTEEPELGARLVRMFLAGELDPAERK